MKKNNKWLKSFLAIIATLAIMITSTSSVNAAASQIQLGAAYSTGPYIAGVKINRKNKSDGSPVYCVEMHKKLSQNITANLVTNSTKIDGGVLYILKNAYPEKSITGDKDKDYYITQAAIWWYQDETIGTQNLGEQFKSTGSDTQGLRQHIKNLVSEAKNHRNDSLTLIPTKLEISTADTSLTLDGDYYVSSIIGASVSSNISSYTVGLTDAPAGTKIEVLRNKSYVETATVNIGESFRIKVPVSSVTTSTLSIKVTASATGNVQYAAYEYQPVDSTMQNVALLEKTQEKVSSTLTLTAATTSITVIKTDSETGKTIAGAVLVLKNANGVELTRWTSTTNAHVIKNIANGSYTIVEESAPTGYRLNTKETNFTISDSNRNVKINIQNAPLKVVVNITKVDQATNLPLAGAVLVVKDLQGNIIYKFTSSNQSEVITDIEFGTYTVEELSAPEGYIRNDKIVTFTIDENHLSHQITFENARQVFVPDTASSSTIMVIIGLLITGFGIRFIYKNGKKA